MRYLERARISAHAQGINESRCALFRTRLYISACVERWSSVPGVSVSEKNRG